MQSNRAYGLRLVRCLSCEGCRTVAWNDIGAAERAVSRQNGVITTPTWEKRLMRKNTCTRSFHDCLSQFLTPQVWKQAHQAWRPEYSPPRWALQPLVWVLLSMAWCCGDSHDERFATARAVYVAAHQRSRRPGSTLAGFLQALAKLPMPVLRALARGVRERLDAQFVEALRINVGCRWLATAAAWNVRARPNCKDTLAKPAKPTRPRWCI